MDRDAISAATHEGVAFANPLPEAAIDAAIAALELPAGARVLDVGCGTGELLARIAARHDARTVGVEPSPLAAAVARTRVDELVEAPLDAAALEPGSFDLVACVASSHAFGSWAQGLEGLCKLAAPGALGLVGEAFWRRPPSAGYLAALGGATVDELPDHDGLLAGAAVAGWGIVGEAIAADADWANYEEALIANGRRRLATDPDPDLRRWTDAAEARWQRPDGRDTLGFSLLTLRAGGVDPVVAALGAQFGLGDEDVGAWRESGLGSEAFAGWLTDRVARARRARGHGRSTERTTCTTSRGGRSSTPSI